MSTDTSSTTTVSSSDSDYIITKHNGWTEEKKRKLLEWQQQAKLHSVGHGRAQEYYSKKNDRLLIPSILFGALGVFFDGVALVLEEQHIPFIVVALLFTAIATVMDGILQATKPTDDASSHEDLAKGYNKIVLEIDSMLTKENKERQNGSRFLTKIENELITLKTGGMKVPSNIWKDIRKAFLAGDLDFQKIENDPETPFVTKATIRRKTLVLDESSTDSVPREQTNVNETTVDIPVENIDDAMPKFELNIGSDPVSKELEKSMFDFQMSRFGPT